jgi:hypothetical protein
MTGFPNSFKDIDSQLGSLEASVLRPSLGLLPYGFIAHAVQEIMALPSQDLGETGPG